MASALVYFGNRFIYRIGEFIRHWYKDGFFFFFRRLVDFLERLDRYFALRVTFHYLFQPLYQNYTFVGYVLGFIFRSIRVGIAGFVYFWVILSWMGLYLLWAFIPLGIIYKIIF
ncbi:hypothetical protein A3G50_00590 [Candidatus Jorgensenbacteria bacterium RIFCSPLOWO2_12_FULL_42_11]|uniref:Uncharacterized protein n=1 Tax=Candidatus Jorgensenbacteria bacterium RIFCSPLOWO2_12_FULL_42_11 TaxID=1798473 RepID=A0A1F6C0Y5_9BACT|nr:MAG: hypothetical protein A3G50_00590 [Candidatus Jorgensenbacteria bacterium RIFCSPLOWO2_12_FULL_42_11]